MNAEGMRDFRNRLWWLNLWSAWPAHGGPRDLVNRDFWVCLWERFWKIFSGASSDWVKQLALLHVVGLIQLTKGLKRTTTATKAEKGRICCCYFCLTTQVGHGSFLLPWDGSHHLLLRFSGFWTHLEWHPWLSWVSSLQVRDLCNHVSQSSH